MKEKESNKAVSEKEHAIQMYRKIIMDKGLDRQIIYNLHDRKQSIFAC